MDGLHSPWGIIGKIMDARGWTREQVLWGESWINLMLQNADQARYVKQKSRHIDNIDELREAMGR
jgi:hypothetical protein